MQPARLDLAPYAGDGFAFALTFTDKATGDPYPVPGEWRAEVRATADATTVLAAFTIDTTNADTGTVVLSLTGAQTQALPCVPFVAAWDVEHTPPGAEPRTWYRGVVRTLVDVTRDAG